MSSGSEYARAAFEAAKAAFAPYVTGLKNLRWEDLPAAVVERIKNNPGSSAFQIVCLLVTLVPGLFWAPAVAGAGVASAGPVSGSLFAGLQSVVGTPYVMSVVQSAGMGGYGVGILNAVTQGVATGAGFVTEVFKSGNRTGQVGSYDGNGSVCLGAWHGM